MNEQITMTNDNEKLLDTHIEAARMLDEQALAEATRQFRAGLPEVKTRKLAMPKWLRVAAVAATLVLAVSVMPFFLPGQPGSSAFAQAQAWFESYRSMHFVMTTTHNGRPLSTVEVWTDETGATRVDVPPISHIIIPAENVMHTLLPGGQTMSRSLGLRDGAFELGDGMEWLDELLEFQGLAETVETPRLIDGIDALGWRLTLSGGTHTLWVDPADNRPLMLDAELAGGVQMESVFEFDQALPADVFLVPPQP
jgi:outer membrane lipoprotein-sorting protein